MESQLDKFLYRKILSNLQEFDVVDMTVKYIVGAFIKFTGWGLKKYSKFYSNMDEEQLSFLQENFEKAVEDIKQTRQKNEEKKNLMLSRLINNPIRSSMMDSMYKSSIADLYSSDESDEGPQKRTPPKNDRKGEESSEKSEGSKDNSEKKLEKNSDDIEDDGSKKSEVKKFSKINTIKEEVEEENGNIEGSVIISKQHFDRKESFD